MVSVERGRHEETHDRVSHPADSNPLWHAVFCLWMLVLLQRVQYECVHDVDSQLTRLVERQLDDLDEVRADLDERSMLQVQCLKECRASLIVQYVTM